MTVPARDHQQLRVAILAPTGRDADLTAGILGNAGLASWICSDMAGIQQEIEDGAGVLLIAEEAITDGGLRALAAALSRQEPWSDLPVLLLTRFRADSSTVATALQALGNVTLLERPVRPSALVSTLRASQKARERQYQLREHLRQQQAISAAFRDSEGRLQAIIQQAMAGIAQCDLEGRFLLVNPRFCEIAGYTRDELLNMRHQDLTHPQDQQRNAEIFSNNVARQRGYVIEKRYVRKDGDSVWVRNSVAVMRDCEGQAQSMVAIVIDVTDRKRAEEELKESDRRKDEFLATLAHELRNPLAPIRNGLQVLRLGGANGAMADEARLMMERQLGQMVHLIDDLLDLSRISRGKIELRKERIELGQIIQQAVETSRPVIEQSGHDLTVNLSPGSIYVDADVTRLTQVFSNLLNNAAKYTERAGRIRLSMRRENNEVVVSVKDSGMGIPAKMLPKVFEMFTQVDRNLERSQGGLGIGLSIVKRLVEMHHGSVEARSDGHGRGSEFVVRLPVVLSVVEPQTEDAEPALSSSRRRILVVDDNRDAAMSLAMMLNLMGNDTKTAHDGLESLEAAATFRPDLILLDIGMPRLNGYDTARRIREQPWGQAVRLVALTGWGQEDDRRKSQDAGFDSHIVKPIEPAALEKLLASLQADTA